VTRLDSSRGDTSHRWPYFLPDGRHYVYLVASFASSGERDKMGIYAGSLDSQEDRFLLRANSSVGYAPPGYLLFVRDRNLLAQPFDPGDFRLTGEPIPVAEGIQYFAQIYDALFSVSTNGVLLYQSNASSSIAQLVWFDRGGRRLGPVGTPGDQADPMISPDGRRVALHVIDPQTGNMDIWAYESTGGVAARLTSHPGIDAGAIWSPDGKQIAFTSIRGGHADLYLKSSSGAGAEEAIFKSERSKYLTDWSADGRYILFRAADAESKFELWLLPVSGDRKPSPFIKTTYSVDDGQFSPDGHFVAYASNESGRWEIYVTAFPGPGGNWKVSSEGGSEPRWRRDGKELFYLAPDGTLMAATVRLTPTFEADPSKPLFSIRRREPVSTNDVYSYDVSADGQRFLVNTDVGETTTTPLTVVSDWAANLKR